MQYEKGKEPIYNNLKKNKMQTQTIKIVQKFFTKTQAAKASSYQKAKAKKENMVISKVEIINAHELFKMNGWLKNNPFKRLGFPTPEDFLVIVHYNHNITPLKTTSIKRKIQKASKLKNAGEKFHIVRLTGTQKKCAVVAGHIYVSSITVPAFRFRFRSTLSIGKMLPTSIPFQPQSYRYSVAA